MLIPITRAMPPSRHYNKINLAKDRFFSPYLNQSCPFCPNPHGPTRKVVTFIHAKINAVYENIIVST